MRFLPLVLFLLAGCAAPDARFGWGAVSPVDYTIDSAMPPDCRTAAVEAYDFWSRYTDRLSPREVSLNHRPAAFAEITVRAAQLSPGTAGLTLRVSNGKGQLKSAEILIDLDNCAQANTAAHELGHALGLGHHDDSDHLMFPLVTGGWKLDQDEIEWIR